MRLLDIISTANSNLRRSKLRTFLTISAVFIGSFTLSLTNGLGSGANQFIDSQLRNVSVENSLVITKTPAANSSGNPFSGDVQEYNPDRTREFGVDFINTDEEGKIKEITAAEKIYPAFQVAPQYITAGDKKYVAQISNYLPSLKLDLLEGKLIEDIDSSEIIIPEKYAKALYNSPAEAIGKKLTVRLQEPTGETKDFEASVAAVTKSSLINNGSLMASHSLVVEMNEFQTSNVPNLKNKVAALVAVFPKEASKQTLEDAKTRLVDAGFQGQTLEDQIGSVKGVISGVQLALNIFGAIALLAASFGIINTLLMAVFERTREIGLLKSLGMSRQTIFSIFALEAVSIGFWGGLFGVLASIGAGMVVNKYASATFLKDFPGFNLLAFPPFAIIQVLGLVMLISFIAGVLPSLKASRLNPIEALRFE